MNNPRSSTRPGVFAHAAGLLAAFTGYFSARLKLAGIEAREAAINYAILIGLLLAALVVLVFGYFFLCFFIIFGVAALIGGDYAWIWVTLGMALLHIGAAVGAVFLAKSRLSKPVFEETMAEFKKDQEWLTNESRN